MLMLKTILHHLQITRFRDLAGTRNAAVIPVSESLANQLIAAFLPPNAAVRDLSIHPEARDHFSVRIGFKAAILPAITLKLVVERQPQLPASPVLTLRMVTLGGLFGLASGAVAGMLPPGIRLDGERILVDLREMAARGNAGGLFDYLTDLQIHTDEGRLVLHANIAIG